MGRIVGGEDAEGGELGGRAAARRGSRSQGSIGRGQGCAVRTGFDDGVQPGGVAAVDLFEVAFADQAGTGDGESDLLHGATQS